MILKWCVTIAEKQATGPQIAHNPRCAISAARKRIWLGRVRKTKAMERAALATIKIIIKGDHQPGQVETKAKGRERRAPTASESQINQVKTMVRCNPQSNLIALK